MLCCWYFGTFWFGNCFGYFFKHLANIFQSSSHSCMKSKRPFPNTSHLQVLKSSEDKHYSLFYSTVNYRITVTESFTRLEFGRTYLPYLHPFYFPAFRCTFSSKILQNFDRSRFKKPFAMEKNRHSLSRGLIFTRLA